MTEKKVEAVVEEVVETAEVVEAPEVEVEAGETPGITTQDLQSIAAVIDLATQRGCFRAGEMSKVGPIYDKLAAFLEYIAAQQEANAAAEGDADETE